MGSTPIKGIPAIRSFTNQRGRIDTVIPIVSPRRRRAFSERWRVDLTKGVVCLIVGLYLVGRNRWEAVGLASDAIFTIGITLVGVATAGRIWCSLYIAGYKTNTLITVGPYSLCRNPLYLFSLVGCAGVGLTTETIMLPAIALICFAIYYPTVVLREEGRLLAVHGEAYAAYQRSTPRLCPSFARFEEPDLYQVRARIFRRSLLDAMGFIWAVGAIEFGEALHEHGLLPAVVSLW